MGELRCSDNLNLLENRKFLRDFFESIPCGIGIYTMGENPDVIFLNKAYFIMYGFYAADEYASYDARTDHDFFDDVYPDDIPVVKAALKKRLTSDGPVNYESRSIKKDGSVGCTRCSLDLITLPDGQQAYQEIIIDITHEKEEEKERTLNKYGKSLLSVFSEICELDLKANTMRTIAAYDETQFKRPRNMAMTFRHIAENIVHPGDKDAFLSFTDTANILKRIKEKEFAYTEIRMRKDPGSEYSYVAITILPVEGDCYLYCLLNIDARIKQKLLEEENRHLQDKIARDLLTGILNRSTSEDEISKILSSEKANERSAFIILDIDDFKKINDTYGHPEGDRILKNIGQILKNMFRKSDIVGRFGGDEFVIFLSDIDNDASVIKKVSDVVEEIHRLKNTFELEVPVSASFGITMTTQDSKNFQDIFDKADKALYTAKRNGKNRYAIL